MSPFDEERSTLDGLLGPSWVDEGVESQLNGRAVLAVSSHERSNGDATDDKRGAGQVYTWSATSLGRSSLGRSSLGRERLGTAA